MEGIVSSVAHCSAKCCFGNEGPLCRWHLLSGKSGLVRELTNVPDLAEALATWCECVSGGEPDRHVQANMDWHQLGILWG